MIRFVVDSTCDIPKPTLEKYNIAVVPLQVVIGDKSYRDGVEISVDEVFGIMRQGILPKTAQVNMGDFDSIFRSILEAGDDLVFLCFSSAMSGTYEAACIMANQLAEEFPERSLRMVDSEGGSFAVGMIVTQAARWAAQGKSIDEIIDLMGEMTHKLKYIFTLDSLDWLAKGGRIVKPASFVGDALKLKPILDVHDKTLHVIKIGRGRRKTINTIMKMLVDGCGDYRDQLIGIAHSDDYEVALQIQAMVHELLPEAHTVIVPIGSVLGTHLGRGGFGVFYMDDHLAGYDLMDETFE